MEKETDVIGQMPFYMFFGKINMEKTALMW